MGKELSIYSTDDLKSIVRITISKLKVKYAYLNMEESDFEAFIDEAIKEAADNYSKKINGSFDELFTKSIELIINKYIRSEMQKSTLIVENFISNELSSIKEDENIQIKKLDELYQKSNYNPDIKEAQTIIEKMPQLKLIIANVYSKAKEEKKVKELYEQSSNVIKTYIEAFCDKYNIDLLEVLTGYKSTLDNSDIDYIEAIKMDDKEAERLYLLNKSNLINSLKNYYKIENDEIIKKELINYIKTANPSSLGTLANNIRTSIEKTNNKSYDFEVFLNKYPMHIEFVKNNVRLSDIVLRSGVYKYLGKYASDNEINNIIKILPEKYLKVLTQAYGTKGFRYYEFNKNMGDMSKDRLSFVLLALRDYIKYNKGQYSFTKKETQPKKKNQPIKNTSQSLNKSEKKPQEIKVEEEKKQTKQEQNITLSFDNLDITKLFTTYGKKDAIIIMLKLGMLKDNRTYTTEELSTFFRVDSSYIVKKTNDFLTKYKEKLTTDTNKTKKLNQ